MIIIDFLKGTPIWVYLAFVYVMILGIKSLKDYEIPISRIFFIPIILTCLSIYNLIHKLSGNIDIFTWAILLSSGSFFGFMLTNAMKIKLIKEKKSLVIPGNISTLILFISIFATKYFFGALYSINPETKKMLLFHLLDIGSSGVITGFFIGRTISYIKKLKSLMRLEN